MTEEASSFGRSVVCIDGTTQTADIDRDYDQFVKPMTGVVARLFGHDCFRVDLSANIDSGLSWQLGFLLAHGLHAAQQLAQDGAVPHCLHWATGTVRSRGLQIGDVRHLPEKIAASLPRFREARAAGQRVIVSVPQANAGEIGSVLAAELEALGIEINPVQHAVEAFAHHGLSIDLPAGLPSGRQANHGAGRLPVATSSLVGRQEQQKTITTRLREGRLVSVVGPGGVGKTRIAVAVADELARETSKNVWFVDLSDTHTAQAVDETVCAALGVGADAGRRPRDSVKDLLRHRRALLVFDNCEQIVDAVAELSAEILGACPEVRVLATSREALRIASESVVQLQPLSLPTEEQKTAASIADSAAVQLFSDRARAAVPGFSLTEANASAIAAICRALDGLPLAIELAVSRLRGMSVEELASRLDSVFAARVPHLRGLPSRHQTLQALLQWSVDHLEQPERDLFALLGVFAGGCTARSAAGVAGEAKWRGVDLEQALVSLADRSLLVADTSRPVTRYRMLETTRRFAVEMLSGEEAEVLRLQHARTIAALMAQAASEWATTPTVQWLAAYGSEKDNVRAALEWCFGEGRMPLLGAQLTGNAMRLWDELALPLERERWFAMALEQLPAGAPAALDARLWLGATSRSSHGDRSSIAPARRAAAQFEAAGDQAGLGEALHRCGASLLSPFATTEALELLEQAERVLVPLGPTKMLANCLRSQGLAHGFSGDMITARRLLNASLAAARAVGDDRGDVAASIAKAELEFAVGQSELAIDIAREILADDRVNLRQRTLVAANLASYLFAVGESEAAAASAMSSLRDAEVLGWPAGICRALEYLALALAQSNEGVRAARLLGFTAAFYAKGAANREYTERFCYEMLRDRLDDMLDLDRLEALMMDGATLTAERAIAIATRESGAAAVGRGDTVA